jgi:hypothetical protein
MADSDVCAATKPDGELCREYVLMYYVDDVLAISYDSHSILVEIQGKNMIKLKNLNIAWERTSNKNP